MTTLPSSAPASPASYRLTTAASIFVLLDIGRVCKGGAGRLLRFGSNPPGEGS